TGIWGLTMNGSARMDGRNAHDDYVDLWGDLKTGFPHSLQRAANDHMWSITSNNDEDDPANSRTEFKIRKGTWNTTDSRFDWEVAATLQPDVYPYDSIGNKLVPDWNLAFGPDGQT